MSDYIVNKTNASRKLQLVLNKAAGGGDSSSATKIINNISSSATAQQMYAAAEAISKLMANTVSNIYCVDKSMLEKEEV